jgi:trimethylamine--corrinoid protein Co-methyltransferase
VRTGTDRRTRRRAETTHAVPQPPWSLFKNPQPPMEMLDEDGLARIEATAFRVLEELGLEFMSPEAMKILDANGCTVDHGSGLVKFPREIVKRFIAMAPREFHMYARNPERHLHVGGNSIVLGPVGGTPNCSDLDRGRRPGTFADQLEMMKIFQSLNVYHTTGGTQVEAQDLPVPTRHLDHHRAQVMYTDRVWGARGIGRDRVRDAIQIAAMARGVAPEELQKTPSLSTVINTNSPRRVDKELLSGLMAMAEWNQVVCVTPFTLAGAMSPITIAGALALQTAEALGVLAFVQMVKPGCPMIFGGFTSNVDMKTGAPAFGTPEYVKATIIGGQLARRYNLPYRASNVCASNAVDAQATYESAMSIWACTVSHSNWIHHAGGWLEGGLTSSFEKIVIDAEIWETMKASLVPLDVSDEALAFDAIADVPPGGHYFGTPHTLARFETAFHRHLVSDIRPFQTWAEAGSPDTTKRANLLWKRLLETYQQPPLEPGRQEAIDAYIARRRVEIELKGLA